MGRTAAIVWHASFSFIAAGLYFLFVLPRWWELTGFTPHSVGTALRIVVGIVIGLAALPVAFTLLRTRRPEYGTPELALRLLIGSIAAHVLAGVLIVGTAISEIWLSLDKAGQWLFGSYGAAAAIALLGIGAFYLSFVAELPPPPPKPLKPAKEKQPRRLRRKGKVAEEGSEDADEEGPEEDSEDADEEGSDEASEDADEVAESEGSEDTEAGETEDTGDESAEATPAGSDTSDTDLVPTGGRHKLQPSGKRRRRNRG